MATISDVAKNAGVSKSTVSKYFNHPEMLTEEYRLRVETAVKELNYSPSPLARSMRTKCTNQIALVVPHIYNPFFAEIFTEMREYAFRKGYRVFVYTTEDDQEQLNAFLDNTDALWADGIIMAFLDEDELVSRINNLHDRLPVTLIGCVAGISKVNTVIVPLNESFYSITKYVISLGHRDIAYIGGPADSRVTWEKLDGYRRALRDAGIAVREDLIKGNDSSIREGFVCAQKLLRQEKQPTAIVSANDEVAIGVVKCLRQYGISIPEHMVVTGHDGTVYAKLAEPQITTMEMPIAEMSRAAVDFLLNRMQRPRSKNQHIIYDTKLVERQSTNPNAISAIEL